MINVKRLRLLITAYCLSEFIADLFSLITKLEADSSHRVGLLVTHLFPIAFFTPIPVLSQASKLFSTASRYVLVYSVWVAGSKDQSVRNQQSSHVLAVPAGARLSV